MARTFQKQGSILLIKGLDVSQPKEYISEQAASATENFYVNRGVLVKRTGTVALGLTLSERVMNGKLFTREGVNFNVRVGLTKIERYNVGGAAWADITGSAIGGSSADLVDIATPLLSNKRLLCITNGVDAIRKWTGSGNTADLGGTPPKCKFIQEYKTYLVTANITGGTDVSQRIQWSDTANPENWSTGNSGAVDLVEDGGDITGLNIFGNYVCVHKKNSIYMGYLVNTSAIFRFDRKSTGSGTIANATIQNLPTGFQAYLGQDGIRIFNGITSELINSPINDEIRDSLNAENAFKSWSYLEKSRDEVCFGIPIGSQTEGETVYRYNYITGNLYKDIRVGINAAWLGEASSTLSWDDMVGPWDSSTVRWDEGAAGVGSDRINFGDTAGINTVIDPTALTDNTAVIACHWDSKDFTDEIDRISRWSRIELWAKGTSVKCEYSTDNGQSWVVIDTFTLTSEYPMEDAPLVGYFDTVASKIRIRFSNEGSTDSVGIKQFILGYRPREYRR